MPFLLNDMSDSLGQMVVVPDDKWDEMIAMLHRYEIQFIETDQGPFIYVVEYTIIEPLDFGTPG